MGKEKLSFYSTLQQVFILKRAVETKKCFGNWKRGDFWKFKYTTIHSRDSWPDTSYMKAIDIWMVLCYIGVFYSLTECCFVIFAYENPNAVVKYIPPIETKNKHNKTWDIKGTTRKILSYATPIAPLYNFLFIVIYFSVCLCHQMPNE